MALVDVNTNGMSDVWEAAYSAINVDPGEDLDGDGEDNLGESVAGTDPYDTNSVLRVQGLDHVGGGYLVRWDSVAGKRYQLESSTSLVGGEWTAQGPPTEGTGASVLAAAPQSNPPILALRVAILTANAAIGNSRPYLDHIDTDLDGAPDIDEWAAGTNPFYASSRLAIESVEVGSAARVTWHSMKGKNYQLESTDGAASGAWTPETGLVAGTGSQITATVSVDGDTRQYRVCVSDSDSDSDGITDWEEKFTGLEFGPWHYRTNFPTDPALITEIVTTSNVVNIEPGVPTANASGGTPGSFVITRAGNLNALTVNYTVAGGALPGTHYQQLPGAITIPPGVHSVKIPVTPLGSLGLDPTRSVVLGLTPDPSYSLGTNTIAQVNILREAALSVTDFGAVGDGVTDDTLPIQAAIDALEASTAHNTLHFPAGSYRLNTWNQGSGGALGTWNQLLVLGNTDLAGRDLLVTADPGAELYSTVSSVRARMLATHATFRSLTFRGLTWRKNDTPLPVTTGEPSAADGVSLFRYDLRKVEAVDFVDCRFINCHGAVFVYNDGFDARGKLAKFGFKNCEVLNPYGSNTKNGAAAFGGGQQVNLHRWVRRAVYADCVFDGGTNGAVDPARNPGGVRKDGSHFGSPLELIFTNNVVRRMGIEAIYQLDNPYMGATTAPFTVPPADGSTTTGVVVREAEATTYQKGQILNFRIPLTPQTTPRNVLLKVDSFDPNSRTLFIVNEGLAPGEDGSTVPSPANIFLQSYDPTIARIVDNSFEDKPETPVGFLAIGANAKALISGNFVRNYRSAIQLYEANHNILNPPTSGTLMVDNVLLVQDTRLYPLAWGIWSHGPEEIIANNLIVAPNSRAFVGVVTRGPDGWVEGNTVLAVNIERGPYDSPVRSVGIAAGNSSSNTVNVDNWTYGMDVGNGPEQPFQSVPRRVITHFSTNDTLAVDPIGLLP